MSTLYTMTNKKVSNMSVEEIIKEMNLLHGMKLYECKNDWQYLLYDILKIELEKQLKVKVILHDGSKEFDKLINDFMKAKNYFLREYYLYWVLTIEGDNNKYMISEEIAFMLKALS